MLADTWAAAAVPHHALSGLPLALLLLLLPGLCSCSCSDSAPNSFPGQILTTSPLRATTTCSCEDSPSGFSAGCSPSGLPGSRSTFPSSLPSLVDFDLFSSVFPLLTRGHVPGLQTGHKGFHMCRTEEGAVGLFLSVLLRGYPAVGTQQTWACPVRGQRGEQWGMLRAAPGCQVLSSVFLGWHRFRCWGYTCRWCWGGSRFPMQRFFFLMLFIRAKSRSSQRAKACPRGSLCHQLCMAMPAGCEGHQHHAVNVHEKRERWDFWPCSHAVLQSRGCTSNLQAGSMEGARLAPWQGGGLVLAWPPGPVLAVWAWQS